MQEAEQHRQWVEREWERKYERTFNIMKEILRFRPKKHLVVFVSHPILHTGRYNVKLRCILWAHTDDWPNYAVVNLWHEALHSYFPLNHIAHAIIELACNEELRIRLNGGHYPAFVGHARLRGIKEKLLPYWRRYLEEKDLNIFQFYGSLKRFKGQ